MKLDITRKTDLAVRVLQVLAKDGGRTKGSELAERIGATASFLPQVVAPLVQQRWVRSDPGPTGGYALAVDLDDISVLDVIEAVEGPTETEHCVLDGRRCKDAGHCVIHDAWTLARSQFLGELAATSLNDIDGQSQPS
ncbi:MAG: RrF2 family transcriptional regulator [Acidimicrobiales bacterium]